MLRSISILGSTGSIGTQTLDVIRESPNIKVMGLSTNQNIDLLEEQIIEFKPIKVAVMDNNKAKELKKRLYNKNINTEVLEGHEGLVDIATLESVDTVVTSVVGMIGLIPTIRAIESGKDIALANKETLVTAGEFVMNCAKKYNVNIFPVDSEHSAIFQCLRGNENEPIERIILTASGGPFRNKTSEELKSVSISDALNHPNWKMGPKISIDSATMMNKGLEVIEAKWLFNTDNIDVIVHPQSIIHSMVEFKDGNVMAQLSTPDMRGPIQYALNYPNRNVRSIEKLDLLKYNKLTFENPNKEKFPCLELAYKALEVGGTMPAVLNAANEIAVDMFLNNEITFTQIPKLIHDTMKEHINIRKPSLTQILEADAWARDFSRKKVTIWS